MGETELHGKLLTLVQSYSGAGPIDVLGGIQLLEQLEYLLLVFLLHAAPGVFDAEF